MPLDYGFLRGPEAEDESEEEEPKEWNKEGQETVVHVLEVGGILNHPLLHVLNFICHITNDSLVVYELWHNIAHTPSYQNKSEEGQKRISDKKG